MTQRERVLQMLDDAGEKGVTTAEFLQEYLYKFHARITDLRQDGYNIPKAERITESCFRYRLVKEAVCENAPA
jgi:hypothetical protein